MIWANGLFTGNQHTPDHFQILFFGRPEPDPWLEPKKGSESDGPLSAQNLRQNRGLDLELTRERPETVSTVSLLSRGQFLTQKTTQAHLVEKI